MDKKENFKDKIIEFLKFSAVGVSNVVVTNVIYFIFVFINKDLFMVGNTLAFIVGVLNAYYWNRKFVFEDKPEKKIGLLKSYLVYGITFLVTSVLIYIFVKKFYFSEKLVGPMVNILLGGPMNYFLNKYLVFRKNNGDLENKE